MDRCGGNGITGGSASFNAVWSGSNNNITAGSAYGCNTILGGDQSCIDCAPSVSGTGYVQFNVIGNGSTNCIRSGGQYGTAYARHNVVMQGRENVIRSYAGYPTDFATIFNGRANCQYTGGPHDFVGMIGQNITFDRGREYANGVGLNVYVARGGRTYFEYIEKTTNNFKIHHPDPAKCCTHLLFHSVVETPTAGDNIYRFEVTTVSGSASITLPDYHRFLNSGEQVWVTPKGHTGRAMGSVSSDQRTLQVTSDTDGEYQVLMIATRKDAAAIRFWAGTETMIPKQRNAIQ